MADGGNKHLYLKFATAALISMLVLATRAIAADPGPEFVHIPMTVDNNRVTIEVKVTSAEGKTETVRAWVDTGSPDLWISSNLAERLGLWHHSPEADSPLGRVYLVETPRVFAVSGFELKVPRSVRGIAFVGAYVLPGLDAEISIPASVLTQSDVEFDYPNRRLGIGVPGSGDHQGIKTAISVDSTTSRVLMPAVIDGVPYQLGLDSGAGYSSIDPALMLHLLQIHPDWPNLTGYLGPSNNRGMPQELGLHLIRVPHMTWGPLQLNQVGAGELIESAKPLPSRGDVIGALGGNVLKNFRIDIDYANGVAYFDKTDSTDNDQLDMVGLILKPEADGSYSIQKDLDSERDSAAVSLAVDDRLLAVDGIPVTHMTLGKVIEALSGVPGETKQLLLQHGANTYLVRTIVRRHLPAH